MLWQKRSDFLTPTSDTTDDAIYGKTFRWEITRDFTIESIYIRMKLVTGGAFSTSYKLWETWFNMIKRVTLTVSDGARTRNVVDASGVALAEYARQILGGLDSGYFFRYDTDVKGARTYYFTIPIFFACPQISDPVSSAFLLPCHRFNSNPVLTLQTNTEFNAGGEALTNDTGAVVIDSYEITPVVNRRDVLDRNWVYYDTEQSEFQVTLSNSGLNRVELPVPGSYTGIMMRFLTSAANPTRVDPDAATNPENRLQYLGHVIRRWRMQDLLAENEMSCFMPLHLPTVGRQSITTAGTANSEYWQRMSSATTLGGNLVGLTTAYLNQMPALDNAGCYFLDFLTDRVGESVDEVGSVLDTNPLMATGARFEILHNTAAANYVANYFCHRIFGNLADLKPRVVSSK